MNQEWIKKFIKLTKNKNLTFTLQTNGVLLDKTNNYILENLDFIFVSIDGNKKITDKYRGRGTYNKILSNLRSAKPKIKGKLLARMTLTPENSVYDSVTHLLNLNIFDYIFWQLENSQRKINYSQTKKRYQKDIRKLTDLWIENIASGKIVGIIPFQAITLSILNKKRHDSYRCGAGTYLVTIDSDGNCYSCDELLEPEFKIGSINNGIKQRKLSSPNRSKFCLDCDIGQICGGRCFKASLKFPTEKFKFYCDMTKILAKEIQNKIPQIKSLIQKGKISARDLGYDCVTEEIP